MSELFQNLIEKHKIPHCPTVGTVLKSNRKTKNTTLSDCRNCSKIQSKMIETKGKWIPLTKIYRFQMHFVKNY